jgi:hypothetical protein
MTASRDYHWNDVKDAIVVPLSAIVVKERQPLAQELVCQHLQRQKSLRFREEWKAQLKSS